MSILAPNADIYCNDEIDLEQIMNSCVPTRNQALSGQPNKRTLVKPTIVAQPYDLTYWRDNPAVFHSQINRKTIKYPILSGWDIPEENFVPLQPNVYTTTDNFQPINATNGIANTPQFPNENIEVSIAGEKLLFDTNNNTYYRPTKISISDEPTQTEGMCGQTRAREFVELGGPTIYNTYDPRFNRYGSDNRNYYDAQQGSQKYFYDDINAIKMPNYITRNKLDCAISPYADAYGKIDSGNISLFNARCVAEGAWVDNNLAYRNDLMKSLMRKRNEEMVQKRQAPKHTMASRRC